MVERQLPKLHSSCQRGQQSCYSTLSFSLSPCVRNAGVAVNEVESQRNLRCQAKPLEHMPLLAPNGAWMAIEWKIFIPPV